MKKMMAAVLAVLMLCLLTGCAKKQEEPNGIMDAVGAGYEMIDQSGGNVVRVQNGENQNFVIQVDLLSETGTMVRPYIFVELGIDFYKIEHSEADFSSVFMHTMDLLAQMQQSEEHREITQICDKAKLPEGVSQNEIGFMNLGYVPDPQQRCEIIFTGMSNTGEGIPIRDEVYAFCRFAMMDGNTPMIMNALVADQNAVYAIAQKVHQAGKLPGGVEEWMLRKLGL
ncbi:MAG: hypothetical protein E7321_08320 [Clostridiales bacterium]|nr:hypothetical protein [Clostridiales bacterium]